jgi:nucleoid DNA-binding protein
MNKRELSEKVSKQYDMTLKNAQDIVKFVFDEIRDGISKGNKVRIVGFGAFEVRKRAARVGRNPHTGQPMDLPETVTPAFSPGFQLLKSIKGSTSDKK